MTTARIGTFVTLHHDAHRRFGAALQALRTRLVEVQQRHQERQMLLVARELDHPGVLADIEAASRQSWGPRALRG
jgi:hypothetical protein